MNTHRCLALAVLSVGCSVPGPKVDVPKDAAPDVVETVQPPAPREAPEWLVWLTDGTTYHIDEAGTVTSRETGIVIATGGRAYRLTTAMVPIATMSCERWDEPARPSAPGEGMRVELDEIGKGSVQVVARPPDGVEGAEDMKHTAIPYASVGPYLFLHETIYAYTCGAHGNTSVSPMLWDVSTGKAVEMPTDFGPVEAPLAEAMRALDALDDTFPTTAAETSVTELVPSYTPDGSLEVGLRFTAPTCYACTTEDSSSYTKSTIVKAPVMPSVLAPYATTPTPVLAFLKTHSSLKVGGYGLAVKAR